MALDKVSLTTAIKNIFEDVSGTSAADKAEALANAIDAFVKSGTVNTTVTVTSVTGVTPGSGSSSSGAGSGVGNIT